MIALAYRSCTFGAGWQDQCGRNVQILHSSFRIESFQRGIQSAAKNLFFYFFAESVIVSTANELFFSKQVYWKIFHPSWPFFKYEVRIVPRPFVPTNETFVKSVFLGIYTYISSPEEYILSDIHPQRGWIILAWMVNNKGLMQKRCSINRTSFLRDFQANVPCLLK